MNLSELSTALASYLKVRASIFWAHLESRRASLNSSKTKNVSFIQVSFNLNFFLSMGLCFYYLCLILHFFFI